MPRINKTFRLNIASQILRVATAVLGDEEIEARWDMSDLAYERMESEWQDDMQNEQEALNESGE